MDVLTAPNIERIAVDRGADGFDDTFRRRFEDATEPDRAPALAIDAGRRPHPPAGEAQLYPTLITDPDERAPLLDGSRACARYRSRRSLGPTTRSNAPMRIA
ncbi:hypothetical protein [Embleya scabrispora]|uniref:hypothetical protein n=1 Tax=Embleya scabrispora TaxID=159449 RepID=UPI00117FF36F|nr:hypothetical protein [Embleya scabrispora]